ncbi:family 16 glycoside hydrolase [Frankia sp. CiP1_Cm_nod2]|uniref:family 16 glycoside hydrolase n=1 Tax=Frankia sp. CiP1_Cm_nod2 TaxID=2897161 RepID=UPI0020244593
MNGARGEPAPEENPSRAGPDIGLSGSGPSGSGLVRQRQRQRHRLTALAFAGVTVLTGLLVFTLRGSEHASAQWRDGTRHGRWLAVFDGYGRTTGRATAGDGNDELVVTLAPRAAAGSDSTHAGLVVSTEHYQGVRFSTRIRTLRQLRQPEPRPWEVGWILWHYTDPAHFYAFVLKPNGWELSKQDPAYPGGQRFLASGPAPRGRLGDWHRIEVAHFGNIVQVSVDGASTVRFQDTEHPYLSGAVGLYSEDAVVEFRGMRAQSLLRAAGPIP